MVYDKDDDFFTGMLFGTMLGGGSKSGSGGSGGGCFLTAFVLLGILFLIGGLIGSCS